MHVRQLSLFVENRPGALARPCRLLADAGISIRTMSLADTAQFGIMRMIIREWEKARALLEQAGYAVNVADIIALEVPDRPGGLVSILEAVQTASVNVEYLYACTVKHDRKGDTGILVFRFNAPDRALEALARAGIRAVGPDDLFAII
jgi:hypothetical protein